MIRKTAFTLAFAVLALALAPVNAGAELRPKSIGGDPRNTEVLYVPGETYRIDAQLRFTTVIEFETGEIVKTTSGGDSETWKLIRYKRGDRISIKPIDNAEATNLVVETDRRNYVFYLAVTDRKNAAAGNFTVRFKYPDENSARAPSFTEQTAGTYSSGKKLNEEYLAAGTADFRPVAMWDDGVNTYMRYAADARRPAVFATNAKGEDSFINFTQHPNHVIQIHALSKRWTLRIDEEYICVRDRDLVLAQAETSAQTSQPKSFPQEPDR